METVHHNDNAADQNVNLVASVVGAASEARIEDDPMSLEEQAAASGGFVVLHSQTIRHDH